MLPPMTLVTKDGYDLQFGTNCIGHWYFTELVMPALLAGVATSPDHHARVVTTSSSAAYLASGFNFDLFKDGPQRRKASSNEMYAQSKLVRRVFSVPLREAYALSLRKGNVIVARQVAKRYAEKGIVSISVNPGMLIRMICCWWSPKLLL